jgi:hypothetical protein
MAGNTDSISRLAWEWVTLDFGEFWYSPNPLYACPSILCLLKSALETLAFVWTFGIGRSAADSAARLERWDDVVHGGSPKNVQVFSSLMTASVRFIQLFFCRYGTDLRRSYAVQVATALSPKTRSTINAAQGQ